MFHWVQLMLLRFQFPLKMKGRGRLFLQLVRLRHLLGLDCFPLLNRLLMTRFLVERRGVPQEGASYRTFLLLCHHSWPRGLLLS